MQALVGILFTVFATLSVLSIFAILGGGLDRIDLESLLGAFWLAWPAFFWGTALSKNIGQLVEFSWLRTAGTSFVITVGTAFSVPVIWSLAEGMASFGNGNLGTYLFATCVALFFTFTFCLPVWLLGTTFIHFAVMAIRVNSQ